MDWLNEHKKTHINNDIMPSHNISPATMNKKPIAISVGEPAGIGPDCVVMLAQKKRNIPWFAIASPDVLSQRAAQLNLSLDIELISAPNQPIHTDARKLSVFPIHTASAVTPGNLNVMNSAYVLEGIRAAAEFCLRGMCSAMVTAPVHKGIIMDAGIQFTGHTEWLRDYCGTSDVLMVLAHDKYRVALVTTHVSLKQVAELITPERLTQKLTLLHQGLQQWFGIEKPYIGVCGLNPHAGEQGHLGLEEKEIIMPTLQQLQQDGWQLNGPFAADTLLTPHHATQYDAVLAMYHDQGLGPIKALYFDSAVNITLGLPFLRVSVDHGTALDLAGTGKASPNSLAAAINTAGTTL